MQALLVAHRRLVLLGLGGLAVVLLAGRFLVHTGAPAPQAAPIVAPVRAPAAVARMFVDVVGAVRRPGLYRLPHGTRIADALARAGGATAKADLDQVNLAAPLADGEQVVVPRHVAGGAPVAPGSGSGSAATAPVQLSTATAEQLDSLPGVGPVTAQKIIDFRTRHGAFHSVDELDAIPGIGPARLAQLRGLVVP